MSVFNDPTVRYFKPQKKRDFLVSRELRSAGFSHDQCDTALDVFEKVPVRTRIPNLEVIIDDRGVTIKRAARKVKQ